MALVVQKFGGTSVSTLSNWRNIAEVVKRRRAEGAQVLIVHSAVSKITDGLEKLLAAMKQSPQFARMWEWTRGLTEKDLKILIEQLTEQIRANQKQKQGSGSGSSSSGSRSSGGGGGGRGPAGPMSPGGR